MTRTNKKTKRVAHNAPVQSTSPRWICHHHASGSDIEAYVEKNNRLEVIAETHQTEFVDAHANAELIVSAVNDYEKHQKLIADLTNALELCLNSKGLSWEAEQETGVVLARAHRVVLGEK